MKGGAIKAVLVLALFGLVLAGAWGCGKKAPPVPPDEFLNPRTIPGR